MSHSMVADNPTRRGREGEAEEGAEDGVGTKVLTVLAGVPRFQRIRLPMTRKPTIHRLRLRRRKEKPSITQQESKSRSKMLTLNLHRTLIRMVHLKSCHQDQPK